MNPDEITAQDIIRIVKAWKEAVVGLDKMVYDDARKEFSLSSMTGFGADGSHDEMKQDFEQVRGDFESNTFVTAVLKHIEDQKNRVHSRVKSKVGLLVSRLINSSYCDLKFSDHSHLDEKKFSPQ